LPQAGNIIQSEMDVNRAAGGSPNVIGALLA